MSGYNLRTQKNKLTNLPVQAIGSEQAALKEGPVWAKKDGLPPTDRNPQKAGAKLEDGDRKEEPSLLSVIGDLDGGRQAIEGEIKNNYQEATPGHQQVSGTETVKVEQGKVYGIGEDLSSASASGINLHPGLATSIVYDDKGRPQLVLCRWREPSEEPPIRKVTPTAPSHLSDSDDSDTDLGSDSSLLLGGDDIAGVSRPPPLWILIRLLVWIAQDRYKTAQVNHQPRRLQTSHWRTAGWHQPNSAECHPKMLSSGGIRSNSSRTSKSSTKKERWPSSLWCWKKGPWRGASYSPLQQRRTGRRFKQRSWNGISHKR